MPGINILHRYTGAILRHSETADTIAASVLEWYAGGRKEADLRGADLRGAVLSDADLRGADLRGADLSDAVLSDADLSDADLSRADLSDADLSDADLSGAVLRDADLRGAVLRGAVLRDADLSGADLSDADLSRADLSGADLRGADLSRARQYVIRIQGSRHEINAVDDDVRVGYIRKPLAEWLTEFEAIGAEQGYTPIEIAEYGAHIQHIAAVLEMRKQAKEVTA